MYVCMYVCIIKIKHSLSEPSAARLRCFQCIANLAYLPSQRCHNHLTYLESFKRGPTPRDGKHVSVLSAANIAARAWHQSPRETYAPILPSAARECMPYLMSKICHGDGESGGSRSCGYCSIAVGLSVGWARDVGFGLFSTLDVRFEHGFKRLGKMRLGRLKVSNNHKRSFL